MRKIIILFVVLVLQNISIAWGKCNTVSADISSETAVIAPSDTVNGDSIVNPSFPGGQEAAIRWIDDHVNYPAEAHGKGPEGMVIVYLVVESDGSIQDVTVERSLAPNLDAEAIRLVKSMPKWTPGKVNGEPVRMYYNAFLPVVFRHNDYRKYAPNNEEQTATPEETETKKAKHKSRVLQVVEKEPTFPGGDKELITYLNYFINYPALAEKNAITGKVVVFFTIEKDGSISNLEIVKEADKLLNNEAVRVIKSMPRWIPGMQNGEPVSVNYFIPVTFGLQ